MKSKICFLPAQTKERRCLVKTVFKAKGLKRQWHEFIANTNGDLKISAHCRQRISERFPDMNNQPDKKFLNLVRQSKPVAFVTLHATRDRGIKVQFHEMIFVVNLKTKKVMSVYHNFPQKVQKSKNGRTVKLKDLYHRPTAKKEARQEIRDSQRA